MTSKNLVFVCIGSTLHHYDCLGPMIGSLLKLKEYNVFGDILDPIHAKNINTKLEEIKNKTNEKTIFIAIDAAIARKGDEAGKVLFRNRGISPGSGVGKKLPSVGDFSIIFTFSSEIFDVKTNHSLEIVYGGALKVINKIEECIKRGIFNMKKCKKCGGTEFGAIARSASIAPVIVKNDKVLQYKDEWVQIEETFEYQYCLNCNSKITEDDLVEESCNICDCSEGIVNGVCPSCFEKIECIRAILPSIELEEAIKLVSNEIKKKTSKVAATNSNVDSESKTNNKTNAKAKTNTKAKAKTNAKTKTNAKAKDKVKDNIETNQENEKTYTLADLTSDILEDCDSKKEYSTEDITKIEKKELTDDDLIQQLEDIDLSMCENLLNSLDEMI